MQLLEIWFKKLRYIWMGTCCVVQLVQLPESNRAYVILQWINQHKARIMGKFIFWQS